MGVKRKTNEKFVQEIFDLTEGEYIPLDEYISSQKYIRMEHKKCGNVYKVTPNVFLKGRRCPFCAKNKKLSTEQFKKEIKEKLGDEYKVIGEYVNNKTKIELLHKKCGKTFLSTPVNSLLHKSKCPHCSITKRKTTEQFKEEVKKSFLGEEYKVIGEYVNNKTKIELLHKKCGNIYEVTPRDFLKKFGNRCPRCSIESKPERIVRLWLEEKNILFEQTVKFYNLKGISKRQNLSFDFKIFLQNGNFCLIEVDGYYHRFSPEGKRKLKAQLLNDETKNEFCVQNNIELLRIKVDYSEKNWDKNMIKILEENFLF
jgi:ribulose bisphosphate carboxylase small subunit